MQRDAWIDELERDLGLPARLRVLANMGGQRRDIPLPAQSAASKIAAEVGPGVALWLADRFGGTALDIPSRRGAEQMDAASRLRAAVLDAGLTEPRRSANDLAREFGVTSMWVRKLRAEMRAEYGLDTQMVLPGLDPPAG